MRTKFTKPITASFWGLDSLQTTETFPILAGFGRASANKAARLRLEIVVGRSRIEIALGIFSEGKNSRLRTAARKNGHSPGSDKTDIPDGPDTLLAAILRSVDAGSDRVPKPSSILR